MIIMHNTHICVDNITEVFVDASYVPKQKIGSTAYFSGDHSGYIIYPQNNQRSSIFYELKAIEDVIDRFDNLICIYSDSESIVRALRDDGEFTDERYVRMLDKIRENGVDVIWVSSRRNRAHSIAYNSLKYHIKRYNIGRMRKRYQKLGSGRGFDE